MDSGYGHGERYFHSHSSHSSTSKCARCARARGSCARLLPSPPLLRPRGEEGEEREEEIFFRNKFTTAPDRRRAARPCAYFGMLQCVAVRRGALRQLAAPCRRCGALRNVAVPCDTLRHVAVSCGVLRCVVARCGALRCVTLRYERQTDSQTDMQTHIAVRRSTLRRVAACCGALRLVAQRCGTPRCLAARCGTLQALRSANTHTVLPQVGWCSLKAHYASDDVKQRIFTKREREISTSGLLPAV